MPRYEVWRSYDKGDEQGLVVVEAESAEAAIAQERARFGVDDGGRWFARSLEDEPVEPELA